MEAIIEMLGSSLTKCVDNASKLNYKYIDIYCQTGQQRNITTPEQVTHEDEKYHTSKKNKNTNKQSFYSLDDFEKFIMNFGLKNQESYDKE